MKHLSPGRQRRWRRPAVQDVWLFAIVAAASLMAYLATLATKPQFAPDSRYYAGMALWFSGSSKDEAARQVAAHSALSGWESPAADVLFGWGLVQPRVVYPGLSAPFVRIFGIEGLAVVPAIATALFLGLATLVLARRFGRLVALATMLLVCTSPMLFFYNTAMLTESLTAVWCVLLVMVVWRYQRTPSARLVAAMVFITVLFAFTRQSTLIPAGAFVSAWFCALVLRQDHRRWRIPALAVGATAILVQVLQTLVFPSFSQLDQFKAKTGADSLAEALANSPQLAWTILRTDINFMAAADRSLLLLLALGVASMVIFWRRAESHMLLGALAAYEIYNVTNGTPTAFRYGTPGLIFVLLSVALLFSMVRTRLAERGPTETTATPRELDDATGEPAETDSPVTAAP